VIQFAHPHLLWLLLAFPPALLGFLWWAARKRRRLLTQFIQSRLLPDLTLGLSAEREQLRVALLLGAVVALILALAGPQWGFTLEEAHQKGLDVVVAIDTSKSMLAEDIAPNRLARAKLAAIDLMQTAKSDRLGLVAFAGNAFLQCPLTIDDAAFRQSVDILDVNTLPQGGTAIAEAIQTAQAAFKQGDGYKILVLFTDGEDHDSNAVEAARKAAEDGMRIFTIGIGSPEGELLRIRDAKGRTEYVRDPQGSVVKSHLNEKMLQDIAQAGHGFYLPLRGAKVIETLYKNGLAPLPKTESETKTYKHYHERFYWPLSLAMVLLVIEILLPTRKSTGVSIRGGSPARPSPGMALLLALCLLPSLSQASSSSALRDYRQGQFDQARAEYERLLQKHKDDPRLALNAGTAAYSEGDLQKANELLSQAITAPDLQVQQQAYYNRGNTLFRTGEAEKDAQAKQKAWQQAVQDFGSAMKLNEQDADAKHNYEYVKKKLEELQQQQQQQQQQNQDQQKDQQQDQKDQKNQQNQQEQQDEQKQDQQSRQNQEQQKEQDQQQQQKAEDQKQQDQKPGQQNQDQSQQQPTQSPQSDKGKPEDQQESGAQGEPREVDGQQQEMTPEQALRLLDATKGDEQVLPLQPQQSPTQSGRPVKDW